MKPIAIALLLLGCARQTAPPTSDAAPLTIGQNPTPPTPPPVEQTCVDDAGTYHLPNPAWTPGKVCTQADPNFKEMRYGGRVAYCVRFVTAHEKDAVAKLYNIPKEDYKKYEFDHYIPLNAGGSDDQTNIWPQPLGEAHEKDKVEIEVYNGLASGTMDQDEAIARIRAWRPSSCPP
jgi:hypothetical protein